MLLTIELFLQNHLFLFNMSREFNYAILSGFKLLGLNCPPASASQETQIHYTRLVSSIPLKFE